MTTLLLFTSGFPYGCGEQFLEAEIPFLLRSVPRLTIIPGRAQGLPRAVQTKVNVELGFARTLERSRRWQALLFILFDKEMYRELLAQWPRTLRISALRSILVCWYMAKVTHRWLTKYLVDNGLTAERVVVYTYWITCFTYGVGLLKEARVAPKLYVLSRAHGYDLYEERCKSGFWPFRSRTLTLLDSLHLISEHGYRYITGRYSEVEPICYVSRLGVKDPGFDCQESSDGALRIVSCSRLVSIKRIPLLVDALTIFANDHPSRAIKWTHIGDGPLKDAIATYCVKKLTRVEWKMTGELPNRMVLEFYRATCVDVFINVSESEGIPVSIMEAQSCGIPVIAPAVGGIPEIVDNANGQLLSGDPGPGEIARGLDIFLKDGNKANKRRLSKDNWFRRYNAARQYPAFIATFMTEQ